MNHYPNLKSPMMPDYYGQRGFEKQIDPHNCHNYMHSESRSVKHSARIYRHDSHLDSQNLEVICSGIPRAAILADSDAVQTIDRSHFWNRDVTRIYMSSKLC